MSYNKKILSIIGLTFLLLSFLGVYFYRLKSSINIAYLSNKKYLPYMMTSLYSAIKNKANTSIYNVYVIAEYLSKEDEDMLKQLETQNVKITFIPTENKTLNYDNLGRFKSFKISIQKLFLSNYLKNIDKVLYIDADTIIQKDLTSLYQTDISNVYIAASKDGLMYQYPQHITELGLDWRKFYFNSGVMLLNLKKIRKDGLIKKSITYFNSHKEVFGDQDVLNVVVKEKYLPLSYHYNCNSTFFEEKDAEFLSQFYEEPVYNTPRENYDNVTILHFAGHKPWTEWFNHSYLRPLWQEYYKEMTSNYNITP